MFATYQFVIVEVHTKSKSISNIFGPYGTRTEALKAVTGVSEDVKKAFSHDILQLHDPEFI